ncbi:hypothetical protein [Rufibacter latericius]|nr:hypothetical protein [Rufibacter latericius]
MQLSEPSPEALNAGNVKTDSVAIRNQTSNVDLKRAWPMTAGR